MSIGQHQEGFSLYDAIFEAMSSTEPCALFRRQSALDDSFSSAPMAFGSIKWTPKCLHEGPFAEQLEVRGPVRIVSVEVQGGHLLELGLTRAANSEAARIQLIVDGRNTYELELSSMEDGEGFVDESVTITLDVVLDQSSFVEVIHDRKLIYSGAIMAKVVVPGGVRYQFKRFHEKAFWITARAKSSDMFPEQEVITYQCGGRQGRLRGFRESISGNTAEYYFHADSALQDRTVQEWSLSFPNSLGIIEKGEFLTFAAGDDLFWFSRPYIDGQYVFITVVRNMVKKKDGIAVRLISLKGREPVLADSCNDPPQYRFRTGNNTFKVKVEDFGILHECKLAVDVGPTSELFSVPIKAMPDHETYASIADGNIHSLRSGSSNIGGQVGGGAPGL